MRKRLAERALEGLSEAVAHAKGKDVPGMVVHVPEAIDVAAIRTKTGLSQSAFARKIGIAVGTLRGWEQKRRQPDGTARVLLTMLDRNPRVVEETLGRVRE